MTGMDVRMVAPRELWCADHVVAGARRVAEATGARLTLTDSVEEGVAGVDFVYTDVWVSMGEPPEAWAERIRLLGSYQGTKDLMAATGNTEVRFMHCLPDLHDRNPTVGEERFQHTGRDALAVTDAGSESQSPVVL